MAAPQPLRRRRRPFVSRSETGGGRSFGPGVQYRRAAYPAALVEGQIVGATSFFKCEIVDMCCTWCNMGAGETKRAAPVDGAALFVTDGPVRWHQPIRKGFASYRIPMNRVELIETAARVAKILVAKLRMRNSLIMFAVWSARRIIPKRRCCPNGACCIILQMRNYRQVLRIFQHSS